MEKLVAIVGRTNVGKSTLFNRLAEQRKAIVTNEKNTTRDRNYSRSEWTNQFFTVIDTGGYIHDTNDTITTSISKQIKIALKEATVILFMVDCQEGITTLDKEFANILRSVHKPILVVANKADNFNATLMAPSFYALGMGTPYPISAANGSGTGELLDALLPHIQNTSPEIEITKTIPRFTILGRPNVGKSSFINVLIGSERSIVTDLAGTTRDSIDTYYKLYNKEFIIVDTAGIRKKSRVKDAIEFYSVLRAIKSLHHSDVCLVMIDAQQGLEAQDLNIISLAHRYKKGIILLVNKWDLIDKQIKSTEIYKKELLKKLAPLDYIPILFTSAVKKQKIYQTIEKTLEVYHGKTQKIATSTLNNVMLEIIKQNAPPAIRGKHIRIKYITQISANAPTFILFCNHPQEVPPNYKRYLENKLRFHFNFQGVPIQLLFKKKS